jgi:hypothetical protein
MQELTIGRCFAYQRTRQSLFLNPHLETLRVFVDRKKLPFAGYSVEKEHHQLLLAGVAATPVTAILFGVAFRRA